MNKLRALCVLGALTVSVGAAHAQTKIQCHVAVDGSVSAALIWQNTLGADRANSICRSHAAIGGSKASDSGVMAQSASASTATSGPTHKAGVPGSSHRFDENTYQRAGVTGQMDRVPKGHQAIAPQPNVEDEYIAIW